MRTQMVLLAAGLLGMSLLGTGCQRGAWSLGEQIKVGQALEEVTAFLGEPDEVLPGRWVYDGVYFGYRLIIRVREGKVVSPVGFEPPEVATP